MQFLLEIRNLSKSYPLKGGGRLQVLEDINFSILPEDSGKIISILAPLRAGKSTLMRILSSIEKPDLGSISLHQNEHIGTKGRINYLPDIPVSYPWLSVAGNIQMALKLRKKDSRLSLSEILALIGLDGYEDYIPHNSSFGFRFRISLGRALAVDPDIILIDDSFRIMDLTTRSEIYELVKKINNSTGKTIILATTNITEAVILSERILFMKKNPGTIFYDLKLENKNLSDKLNIEVLRNTVEKIYEQENLLESLQLII